MDKRLISLTSLLALTVIMFTATVIFNKPLTQLIRAKEEIEPSASASLIFAWPLSVSADGISSSSITVFIRSATGKPVENKNITLTSSLGTLKNSTMATDKEGKAQFSVVSDTKGVAEIEATIDNSIKLTQTLSVKFE